MSIFEAPTAYNSLSIALLGAKMGLMLAVIYAFAFAAYACLRSSLRILDVLTPTDRLFGTLVANAASIVVPSFVIAVLLGIIAAIIQSVTVLLVYWLALPLNPELLPLRGALIGLVISGFIVFILDWRLRAGKGYLHSIVGQSGYVFWFGLPCLVYVATSAWVGYLLSNY